jgi:hypothetical protein
MNKIKLLCIRIMNRLNKLQQISFNGLNDNQKRKNVEKELVSHYSNLNTTFGLPKNNNMNRNSESFKIYESIKDDLQKHILHIIHILQNYEIMKQVQTSQQIKDSLSIDQLRLFDMVKRLIISHTQVMINKQQRRHLRQLQPRPISRSRPRPAARSMSGWQERKEEPNKSNTIQAKEAAQKYEKNRIKLLARQKREEERKKMINKIKKFLKLNKVM